MVNCIDQLNYLMASKSNKLSQFWQELKRRRVIKTIAMDAATAFIIMEVISALRNANKPLPINTIELEN